MGDEELVRRIRQGERGLLDLLIEKYYPDIFRFCYYKTGNESAAYDCTQETFLRMMRFMESYVEMHKFKSYLLRIALNVCRDFYRENSVSTVSMAELESESYGEEGGRGNVNLASAAAVAAETADGRIEEAYVIQQCLMRLPGFQREVIILHFYYGYKVREIAAVTGVSLPTAKSRLKQGLDKLKKILREEGVYEKG